MNRPLVALALLLSGCSLSSRSTTTPSETLVQGPSLAELDQRLVVLAGAGWSDQAECRDLAAGYHAHAQLDSLFVEALLHQRCGDAGYGLELLEYVADQGHWPSSLALIDQALERGDWQTVLDALPRLRDHADADQGVLERVEDMALRIRWLDQRSPEAFAAVEQRAHAALFADPPELAHRAALARLYLERAEDEPRFQKLAELLIEDGRALEREGVAPDAEFEFVVGLLAQRQGRYAQALQAWERSVELDPEQVHVRLHLASLALELRMHEEAREHFDQALARMPRELELMLGLGNALVALDLDAAAKVYERALELDASDPRASWNLARLYFFMEDADVYLVVHELRRFSARVASLEAGCRPAPIHPACTRLSEFDEGLEFVREWELLVEWYESQRRGQPARRIIEEAEAAEEARRQRLLQMEEQAAAAGAPTPAELEAAEAAAEARAEREREKAEREEASDAPEPSADLVRDPVQPLP